MHPDVIPVRADSSAPAGCAPCHHGHCFSAGPRPSVAPRWEAAQGADPGWKMPPRNNARWFVVSWPSAAPQHAPAAPGWARRRGWHLLQRGRQEAASDKSPARRLPSPNPALSTPRAGHQDVTGIQPLPGAGADTKPSCRRAQQRPAAPATRPGRAGPARGAASCIQPGVTSNKRTAVSPGTRGRYASQLERADTVQAPFPSCLHLKIRFWGVTRFVLFVCFSVSG